MAQQIVHELLTNTIAAAKTLDVDATFQAQAQASLDKLDPGLNIGSWGQVKEWKIENTRWTTPPTSTATTPSCTPSTRATRSTSGTIPP